MRIIDNVLFFYASFRDLKLFLVSTKIAHLNFKWIPQKHLNLTKENTINLIKWGKVEEQEEVKVQKERKIFS